MHKILAKKNNKRPREEKKEKKPQYTPGCVIKIERTVEDQTGEKPIPITPGVGTSSVEPKVQPEKAESSDKMDTEGTGEKAQQPDAGGELKSTTENGTFSGPSQKTIPGLYNNNLTHPKLKEHFSKYGSTLFVELIKNLIFVRFGDPESAQKALSDDSGFTGPSSKYFLATADEEKQFYERKNKQFQNKPKRGRGGKRFKRNF